MFLAQFSSPLVFLLFGAVGISIFLPIFQKGKITPSDLIDPAAILTILFFNAALGFFQEQKAEKTLAALKKNGRRNGDGAARRAKAKNSDE